MPSSATPKGELPPTIPAGATACEYHCEKLDMLAIADQLALNEDNEKMNALGKLGWELTGILPQAQGNWVVAVFSRPLAQEPDPPLPLKHR